MMRKSSHLTYLSIALVAGMLGCMVGLGLALLAAPSSHAQAAPPAISKDSSFGAAEAHFDFGHPSAQGLALVDGINGPANCWNWQGKGWFVSWCEPRTVREAPPIRRPDNE